MTDALAGLTDAAAGVDIDAGSALVEAIKPLAAFSSGTAAVSALKWRWSMRMPDGSLTMCLAATSSVRASSNGARRAARLSLDSDSSVPSTQSAGLCIRIVMLLSSSRLASGSMVIVWF